MPAGTDYCGVAGTMGHAELVDATAESASCLLVGTRMPVTARAGLDAALAATCPWLSIGAEAPFLAATHAVQRGSRGDHAPRSLAEFAGPGTTARASVRPR